MPGFQLLTRLCVHLCIFISFLMGKWYYRCWYTSKLDMSLAHGQWMESDDKTLTEKIPARESPGDDLKRRLSKEKLRSQGNGVRSNLGEGSLRRGPAASWRSVRACWIHMSGKHGSQWLLDVVKLPAFSRKWEKNRNWVGKEEMVRERPYRVG